MATGSQSRGLPSASPRETLTVIWRAGRLLPILRMTRGKPVASPRSHRQAGAGSLAQLLPPGTPCWPRERAQLMSLRTLAAVQ